MKKDIHPKYYPKAKVTCVCGNTFEVGSTQEEIKVEICSACHPFYTGKQKLVDSARRVEKFQERAAKQTAEAAKRKGRKVKRDTQRKKKSVSEVKKSVTSKKADDKKAKVTDKKQEKTDKKIDKK